MSCLPIPPSTKFKEPEFEPVTPFANSIPHLRTHAQRILAADFGATAGIPPVNSSPKLRLDFSSDDGEVGYLMSDADFEEIWGAERAVLSQKHRELDERMARLGLKRDDWVGDNEEVDTITNVVGDATRGDGAFASGDNEGLQYENTGMKINSKKAGANVLSRPRPRPLSIIPRSGTLTALPGSRMVDDCEGGDEFPGSTSKTTTPVTSKSTSMPPPPLPASTPTRPANICASLPAPAAMPKPNRKFHHSWKPDQNHKRKLSLSAPFLDNVKRIFISSDTKPRITHLTHDATAMNRSTTTHITGPVEGNNNSSSHEDEGGNGSGSAASTPTTIRPKLAAINPTATTMTQPSPTTTQSRDLATPIFAGPSSIYSSTPKEEPDSSPFDPLTTPKRPNMPRRLLSTVQNRLHRRTNTNASTISTPTTPTTNRTSIPEFSSTPSKSALNQVIVKLRSQISDLNLENHVLKDQIAIVRKDWIDTAQELDLERHRGWEGEMNLFRLGVRIEELRAEIGRLKRGSVAD